jgi:hypothetical protein
MALFFIIEKVPTSYQIASSYFSLDSLLINVIFIIDSLFYIADNTNQKKGKEVCCGQNKKMSLYLLSQDKSKKS